MKKLFLTTSLVLMLFISFAPLTYAAGGTFFGPIVPNGTNGQPDCNCLSVISPNTGETIPSAPDWGCIMQTVQNTVNFAITIGMIIAILYIVYSGFLFVMSAGNPSSREAAKTRLTNVVIGFVVVLAAWLIIDFVMKRLYGESGAFGPWNAILSEDGKPHCLAVSKTPDALPGIVGQPPPGPGTIGSVPNDPGVISAGEMTNSQAVAALTAAGVGIKDGVSLNGTREDTVNQVIAVKRACGCSVTVTSAVDGGHAAGEESHGTGYKIDLRLDNGLNSYLQGMTLGAPRSGDPRYYDRCGNEYVRESDHWDIKVDKGVCSPPRS